MSFESYLSLEASAGSGKTFALSVRYIALLLQGNYPSKILALTFTNKAANEMLQRITTTFCNLEKDDQKAELNALCELLNLDSTEILKRRDSMMSRFLSSELNISTFDSFFATILRQFSLNLGLMPDFDSTNDNKELIRREFERLLEISSKLVDIARYLNVSNSKESDLFNKLDLLSQSRFEISDAPCPNRDKVMQKYSQLCDIALRLHNGKQYISNFDKNLDLDSIIDKPLIKNYKSKNFDKVRDNAEFSSARDEFVKAAKEYYLALESYEISQISKFIEPYKTSIVNVNRRENTLSFDDIANWVNELLTKKDKQDIDMLYFRLDAKIQHILIDEFQDTSIKQYEILEPLIAESVAGAGQSGLGSFFYVGDTKQSIYRFRGGEKGLFDKLKDDFSQIKSQSLDKNYRSDKLVVEYVNSVFKDKYSNYIDQIPNSADNGYVKVEKFSKDEHLDKIYENIATLHQSSVDYDDMAILCWKNEDIDKIKDFLESKGLKVSTQTTNNLTKSANVAAVVEFVKYSIFGDEIYANAVYEILNIKKPKLTLKEDSSVAQTLKYVAKYLGIEPYDIDLLKLYEISSAYSDIYDFVFNIDNDQTKSAKNSQNGITIMTVHKSKGLQFDHVIVLDYLGGLNNNQDKFLIEYNLNRDSWDIRLRNKAFEYLGDENYIELKNRQQKLDRDETINKIYVALTRAKHSLIILAKDEANGKNISYFTQYISSNNTIEYLNLSECEIGSIKVATKESPKEPNNPVSLEPFIKVALQEIDASKQMQKEPIQSESNLDSIYFGKALHYYLESIKFDDSNSKDIAKHCLYNKFGLFLNKDSLEDIRLRVDRLLGCDKFLDIIKDKELLKEQATSFEGVLKRIDLLCMSDDEIAIVDYKTSQNNMERDEAQVREYMQILSQIYPQIPIRASVVYILKNSIQICEIK